MASQSLNGAGPVSANTEVLAKIHDALNVIHSPYSTNQTRQEAQAFLEEVKTFADSPSHGFALASDKSHSPILQHFGLSLLENAVRHRWSEYSPEQAAYIREWTLRLAQNVNKDDPLYVRSKIAQLWVDLAARCWVQEWMDMDEMLVQMWGINDSSAHKELVLQILEALSEEVFNSDNAVVAVREGVLSRACVEIFTPAAVLLEAFPNRQTVPVVRFGDEGWIQRVVTLLDTCLSGDIQNIAELQACAVRALTLLHSLVPWAIPKAVNATGCVGVMCKALAAPHLSVQKVSLQPE
jgi:exportin-5